MARQEIPPTDLEGKRRAARARSFFGLRLFFDAMRSQDCDYFSATRHPWACVLFVLPLLALYEIGLVAAVPAVPAGPAAPDALRNGADVWLRTALAALGISSLYAAPLLLLIVLLLWGLVSHEDRPLDKIGVWVGMSVESAAYALLLVGLSQGLWQVLLRADHFLGQPSQRLLTLMQQSASGAAAPELVWGQIISYIGAGIYEETLFRLLLFAGLVRIFSWAEVRTSFNIVMAALASALLFAGAHHLGPHGDPFSVYVFSFRTGAGLYFAWLYQVRGFGITVGTHAGYDVLVGLIMQHG